MKNCVGIITTLDKIELANAMAEDLVEQKLAACVQIFPIRSVYRWNGKIESSAEFRLEAKCNAEKSPALIAAIKAQHPYDLPEILQSQFECSDEYGEWLESSLE